ncbi:MAG: hypothetical protein FWH56_10400 [Betaproteobacteria bacterium]|nr:hypothetical protein [Betaproteobacteria bacterium]
MKKMRITGIVLLVISVLSFAGMLMVSSREALGDFLFFTFFLGMAGGIFFLLFAYVKARSGPVVIGKVLEIKETDHVSSLILTVRFKTVDGQQVTSVEKVTANQVLNQDLLSQFFPGMPLPLRYHPENPNKIFIAMEDTEEVNRVITEHFAKMENGPFVFGKLISANPTGKQAKAGPIMEFILQFHTVEGQQVTVSYQKAALEEFQPGTLFPLRYNPEEPELIIVGFAMGAYEADAEIVERAINAYMMAEGLTTQEELDMKEHGVKTVGVVLSVQPTGSIVNGYEEMALHVKVTRSENGSTYDVTVKKPIQQSSLPLVQPGSVVDVYYMPDNDENIFVDNKEGFTFGV